MFIRYTKICFIFLFIAVMSALNSFAQIPMEKVLSRVTIPAEGDTRGLVDIVGFPHKAEQMDFIGKFCEKAEKDAILANQKKYHLTGETAFIFGICPHDDYTLAARDYVHIQRYIKAKTVILIGNAHWSEAFGIRNKLIFGDFKYWRGPYGKVKISSLRSDILAGLAPESFVLKRKVIETEHSLEALVPFLQYFNRDVEIVPILIPFTEWKTMNKLAADLAHVVANIVAQKQLKLGSDLAILCSTDGQHYGDYGWSYYNYHPFGCNPDGYKNAMQFDGNLVKQHLTGSVSIEKDHQLYASLIDEQNISNYKVTWCGRFSVTFSTNFSIRLLKNVEQRSLTGYFLRHGSSLSDPWVPVRKFKMGITGDTNLHHFVTYLAIGFK
ncbi:MAG TPA: AmmeMemoRadiSam system protein B [Bacteroidetes bacterium]|nr:AmmeMemoRadiSam system protein B [Bacteroidota bacterium]